MQIVTTSTRLVAISETAGVVVSFLESGLSVGMIATHFRMFRRSVWNRILNCNERIKNAVDLDLWLKINEKTNIEHIHKILYSYRWHGDNTSIQDRKAQENNHLKVVNDSMKRTGLSDFWELKPTNNPMNPREFKVLHKASPPPPTPKDIFFLIPTCAKYHAKRKAVRETWASDLKSYGYRYLFLMGDPGLDVARIIGDVLYVPCRDDYESPDSEAHAWLLIPHA